MTEIEYNKKRAENDYNDIYPNGQKLKRENEDPCKTFFLDLSVEAHDKKFTTKLFDKRGAFLFYIIACPIWIAIYRLKYFILQWF